MTTQAEHLAWCKQRALEILEGGDIAGAWGSFLSDMRNHPETAEHSALMLGMQLVMAGKLSTRTEMKKFIEDFR